MTNKKAPLDVLEALHGELAESLREAIKKCRKAGEPLPASLVKEIREFLKDNGIEQIPNPANPLGGLSAAAVGLPFPGEVPDHNQSH